MEILVICWEMLDLFLSETLDPLAHTSVAALDLQVYGMAF